MIFDHCSWDFITSHANKYKGSFFLVLSDPNEFSDSPKSVTFHGCKINLDKYRLLYCQDTDVTFKDCEYVNSYDTLVDATANQPNRIRVYNMANKRNKQVARNFVLKQ